MNLFESVKTHVSARDAAEYYGIHVNRRGMACCPFHDDKTPSMKVDERYHCFSCGADGDAVNLVAALYGLAQSEAAKKIASDFGISFESFTEQLSKERYIRMKIIQDAQREKEKEFKRMESKFYAVLCEYERTLLSWKEEFEPGITDKEWDPRFVEACLRLPLVTYLLDHLQNASLEEKINVMNLYGGMAIEISRRKNGYGREKCCA